MGTLRVVLFVLGVYFSVYLSSLDCSCFAGFILALKPQPP